MKGSRALKSESCLAHILDCGEVTLIVMEIITALSHYVLVSQEDLSHVTWLLHASILRGIILIMRESTLCPLHMWPKIYQL